MDRQGPPNRPRYQLTRGLTRTRHEKDAMMSHLDRKRMYDAPLGECTSPDRSCRYSIQDVFYWCFAGPVKQLLCSSSLARGSTGPSFVQATGEAVDEMETATQSLEAPSAGTATQSVQAPSSVPDVQPSGEGELSTPSDSEGDQHSVTGSLSDENYQYGSPDTRSP